MADRDSSTLELLLRARTIAVVGLSDKPDRDSFQVAAYLQSQGYRIIPVNPSVTRVLGELSYPSLAALPPEVRVDIVDLFRRSEQVPPVVEEALKRGVGAVWMQLGISNPEAAARARGAGVPVYENLCIRTEHRRLGVPSKPLDTPGV